MRSALVNQNNNIVDNIIVADPVIPSPFEGYIMIGLADDTLCDIGWVYDPSTNTFSPA